MWLLNFPITLHPTGNSYLPGDRNRPTLPFYPGQMSSWHPLVCQTRPAHHWQHHPDCQQEAEL